MDPQDKIMILSTQHTVQRTVPRHARHGTGQTAHARHMAHTQHMGNKRTTNTYLIIGAETTNKATNTHVG